MELRSMTAGAAAPAGAAVEADPGDKVEWTAKDGSGQCANRAVKLANFKLKDKGTAKDPVPGCRKEMTSGGPDTFFMVPRESAELVPEPATISLMLLGLLICLGAAARRRA